MHSRTYPIHKDSTHQILPEQINDPIAIEEPLEIKIEGQSIAVIMRSPSIQEDIELTLGFLLGEGLIEDRDDIQAIDHIVNPSNPQYNTIDIRLSSGVPAKRIHQAQRNIFASSSCGICGKGSIEAIFQHFPSLATKKDIASTLICQLPDKMRPHQHTFQKTGAIHGAALFDTDGNLLVIREDIGRHNAVDKVIGHLVQQDLLDEKWILVVSGRVAFEIAQKSLSAGICAIVAVGAPSSMAIDLCTKANIRLFGFVQSSRCNIYC